MTNIERLLRTPIKILTLVFAVTAVILGGASHFNLVAHHILQLLSLSLLCIAIYMPGLRELSRLHWVPIGIFFIYIIWCFLQIISLPFAFWEILPQRDIVMAGASLLEVPMDSFTISFMPEKTILSMLGFLPPIAMYVYISRVGWSRSVQILQWGIPTIGAMSVVLGLMQVFSGEDSPLYFYEYTSLGMPVGVFANINHQATLCLMSLPFVFALASKLMKGSRRTEQDWAKFLGIITLGLMNLLGVLSAGSVAGYAILVPTLILSSIVMLTANKKQSSGNAYIGIGSIFSVFAFCALTVGYSPVLDGLGQTSLEKSDLSRFGIWDRSGQILDDHIGVGVGLGSFSTIYPLYENTETVSTKYINNAHNDYLQVAIESGLPGIIMLMTGIFFWLITSGRIWVTAASGEATLKKAAMIALMVVLLHSLVDYPLRTPAIATLSAACLAIMVTSQRRLPQKKQSKSVIDQENKKRISI